MSHDTLSFSALMGNVHWNRDTHQTKTIKGMGWSTKSLQNNCLRFFVRLSLPPEISMSGLEKTVVFAAAIASWRSRVWGTVTVAVACLSQILSSLNCAIDCGLAEGDIESMRPELPLDLLNHLRGCALVLLLFSPLFSDRVVVPAWAWACTAFCFCPFCFSICS